MPSIQDKNILIKVIKEEFPGISDSGIAAIMGNVNAETNYGKDTVENAWPISMMFERKANGKFKHRVKTMRKHVIDLGYATEDGTITEKGKEYNKLSNSQKLGVMYEGNPESLAGGYGPLQLTLGKAAGGKQREDQIKGLMKTQGFKGTIHEFMDKISNEDEFGMRATLQFYKMYDSHNWNATSLNDSTAQSLGENVINPDRDWEVDWNMATTSATDSVNTYNQVVIVDPQLYKPVKEKEFIPRIPSTEALEEIKKKEEEEIIDKDFDPSDIETDYNREFNKLDKLKQRQEEEKKEEVELSTDEDPVEDKIETEEERIAREKQERVDSLAIEKAAEEQIRLEEEEYSKEQIKLLKEKQKKEREDLVIDEEVVDEEVVLDTEEEEPIEISAEQPDITGEMVESIEEKDVKDIPVTEEPETVQVEVLDSQGNIKIIETPSFQPKKEEVEITDEQQEEIVEEELVKPKTEDFRTENNMFNAKEYFKALREYKRGIKDEDQSETEEPIILDDELHDEEIIQEIQEEEDSEIIDGKKRNIFKLDKGENVFDFIIGNVEKALSDIKINKSQKVEDDPVDLVQQVIETPAVSEIPITSVTPLGIAGASLTEQEVESTEDIFRLPTKEEEDILSGEIDARDIIKDFDRFPTKEEVQKAKLTKEDIQKKKKEKEIQRKKELPTGDLYFERKEAVDIAESKRDTKTINTLALKYPDFFNINNGVITDNNGNVITTKEDWINAASIPTENNGLGLANSNDVFDSTRNQFDDPLYQYKKDTKLIDEAYNDYIIKSISNETGVALYDSFNLGINETADFGIYNNEMKREILNQIPRGDITKYANEGGVSEAVGLQKILTSLPLKTKELYIHNAKMNILNRQNKIIDKAWKKVKIRGDKYETEAKDFENRYSNLKNTQSNTQKEFNRIRKKYGTFDVDGNYIPTFNFGDWDQIDQTSWKTMDSSLGDLEKQRLELRKFHSDLKIQRKNYNRDIKNLQNRQQTTFASLLWNAVDEKFDPQFKQTVVNQKWNESIRNVGGRGLDVATAFGAAWVGYKVLRKVMTLANTARAAKLFVGTAVADLTAPLWADKVYEYAPNSINEFNSGYTHTGMVFDLMLGVSQKQFVPSSLDPAGEVIDFNYKPTFKHDMGAIEWTGQIYQTMAPGWAGGHGKYTAYSTSKSFARLLPYTLHIMSAYKGVAQQSINAKRFLDLSSKVVKSNTGKQIVNSLSKSWITSPKMMGSLNMLRINHKMTLLDNIADGRARGLDRGAAFTYGNFLSLATGLSQSIMPDYNWINTVNGKGILDKLTRGLRTTGTALPEIGRRQATSIALKGAGKNFLKEHLEEQTDVFLQDIVKSAYLANHSWDIADVHMQAEVLSGTTILTLPLGSVSAVRTRNNLRSTVYNYMKKNALKVIKNGVQERTAIEDELSKLEKLFLVDDVHLSSKQRYKKEQLQKELDLINKNINDAQDVYKVINAAPKHVTDTQVDLLLQKEKLIKEKQELNKDVDKVFNTDENARIDKEIEKIDEEVVKHGAAKYKADIYDKLLINARKLAKSIGVVISEKESTLDAETYAKTVELEKMRRIDWNEKIDEKIAALDTTTKKGRRKADQLRNRKYSDKELNINLDSPGFIFYDDINGKHRIIINGDVAKENNNEAVVLHELLHAVLRKAIRRSPGSIKGLSYMLRNELLNNQGKYEDGLGYITTQRGGGKYDKYKDEVNNLAPDELFNVFVEALAQGNLKINSNFITKIGDSIRRLLREVGINFQITGVNGLVNFLKDYKQEVLSGRTNFSRGMQRIIDTGETRKYFGKPLFGASKSAIDKANEYEKYMVLNAGIDFWDPNMVTSAASIKHRGRHNIYRDKKISEDLELTEKTKAIVAENARIRQLILDEGLKRGDKIVASEELQNQLIENNLPAAVALAKFAANNPNMMGLEKGKQVTYSQFVSGYYEQLTRLAGTYDASVNEFGQYMNTILPKRYGDILEAEKAGAIEGSVGLDAAADIAIDDDTTPDDIQTGPVVDTAERFGIKQDTKPFINKGLKQLKRLRRLQEKLAEQYNEKTAKELAELTVDLESKGMADLDVDLDTGKITVKQAPNLLYKFVAKLFGIDEDKLNPNSEKWLANLRKAASDKWGSNEVRDAQRAVLKHIDVIMSTIFNEGHTAAFKSSGMPNSLLKFGYNKSSKRIGNNYPQYKKPNLSAVDLLKFIGVEKVKGKYVFTIDRNTGTKLLAIASMTDRNMSLQSLNQSLEASGDMDTKIKNSIQDGLSNANYSKSIIYKNNMSEINLKLPALGNALGNVDGDWTYKNVVDIFINTFGGTLSKENARKFAKETTSKTGVLMRYQRAKEKYKVAGYSIEKYKSLEDWLLEELSEVEGSSYESNIMRFLGMDKTQSEAFTPKQAKRGRHHVASLMLEISKEYNEKIAALDPKSETYKEDRATILRETMYVIRLVQDQHASAAKPGDGSFAFEPGTDIWYEIGESSGQRLQMFNNSLDFALWINNFLHLDLQIELNVKEVTKNDVTRTIFTSVKSYGPTLQSQKRGVVIERITNAINKVKGLVWHNQNDRAVEATIAEDVTIKQIQHYAKRLHDPNDNFNRLDFAMHMLTFGSSMESTSRRAAELVGIQDGIIVNGKYTGVEVRYEHGKPHSFLIWELVQIVLKEHESKWDDLMHKPFIDYKVNLITIGFDKTLDEARLTNNMGFGYESGIVNGWVFRLFNKGNIGDSRVGPIRLIDDVINGKDGIVFGEDHHKISNIFIKSNSEIEIDKKVSSSMQFARSIKYTNKLKGITILDFDDTLATTKSGVRYKLPNPTGKPQPSRKVIFLAGAAGSGKSNVVKQLGLKDQGFKIVNSDISLEWLKKNSGLPADMKDLTHGELSKLGKLQYESRQIALHKKMKFQGKGDGVVVDGTGASLNVMKKQVQEFKDKGYDVQMVFVGTSLNVAQERNKARKERSLFPKIVETTWKSVQGNKKAFKELFGDNFSEVNTNKLKQNDPMPARLVAKVDAFTKGYIKGRLNAGEYADKGAGLAAQGAEFDFTEFDKVIDGVIAPLFNKALKLAKKFGTKNMFILTARPAEAQQDIYKFLKSQGLEIPIKNIVGLGNSTAEAKALWVAEKASEGYNDFYFADDALQNVQAVENVLGQLDVKSKVQQAKFSKSINYSNEFNEILEESSGIEAKKRFSKAKARKRGEDKGKYKFFIPPSAEDFVGLIYNFLGKGKMGEKHFAWFKETLLKPLNRAYQELNSAKQAIANDYKQLGKEFSNVRKKLYKKISDTDFTHSDAIRVYLWNKADFYIPGLSESDKNELIGLIENDSELKAYADALGIISKQEEGYVKPGDNWMVEDVRVDLMNATSTVNRKVFFQEFIENADLVFDEENLNKIEAIYGQNFREALEDMLYRVKNGTNRSFGSNRLVNRFMNWINGSIGVTMHFNTRSAVLQSLSMVNFINWTDNNVIAAAKAFANPRQFWADFAMIFNSDMLKQRRAGLNIDVNAAEIASHIGNSKTPFQSALNWLLQKGFLPTQMMDSFAIAAGGATFYRNRLNTYLVQGLNENEAKKKAFEDFQVIAEETQQSARPDMISQQQASILGRLILAFQNTPIQYARLMKKAISDLANGRGDVKTNVSKIVYYGAVQNLIFYSLQTALFAMMFGDDEDDEEFFDKKQERIMNGTLDSLLRGMGVGGAVTSTLKNMLLKFIEQQDKPQYKRDEYAVLMEMLNLSPPIGIKARHMLMAQKTINWNQDAIKQIPLYNLDNPLWESAFLTTQSITNIPLARIQTKVNNLREVANKENAAWQRIAMFLGWSKWNLGVKSKKKTKSKSKSSSARRKRRTNKRRVGAY